MAGKGCLIAKSCTKYEMLKPALNSLFWQMPIWLIKFNKGSSLFRKVEVRVEFGLTKEMDWLFDLNGIFLSQWRWVRCDLSQDRGAVTISGSGECPAGQHRQRCLQQRSHSGTRFIKRIVTLKVIVKITGSFFWAELMMFDTPYSIFWDIYICIRSG